MKDREKVRKRATWRPCHSLTGVLHPVLSASPFSYFSILLWVGIPPAQAKLESETTETQARQIELDRTAEEFRSLHAERQRLVRQWQDTIEAMHRRDVTIQELATQYAEEKRKQAERVENLQQQREQLKVRERPSLQFYSKQQTQLLAFVRPSCCRSFTHYKPSTSQPKITHFLTAPPPPLPSPRRLPSLGAV